MKRSVQGTLTWAETGAAAAGFFAWLHDADTGDRLAKGKSRKDGRYTVSWEDATGGERADCAPQIYLDAGDPDGVVVASTRAFPLRLVTRRATLDLALPEVPRGQDGRRRRQLVLVGPLELDAEAVTEAEPKLVLDLAQAIVDPKHERKVRGTLEALSPNLVPSEHVKRTLCGTELLLAIDALIELKHWPREIALEVDEILRMRRRNDDGHEPRFTELTHLCPNFEITYQDSGAAAVDPDTSSQQVIEPGGTAVLATLPAGSPPTYIKRICFWLERALATYVNPPFSMRNPAAGGRIPVVVNSDSFGSASPSGTFYINNALPADVLCAVAVHELFHMVQYQYSGSGTWLSGMREGGATWAEDTAADRLNRYLDEAGTNFNGSGYMVEPHTSLESSSFRYKTSLLFRYMAEQQSPRTGAADEPLIGVETYRELIERCEAGSWSAADIKQAVASLPWYQDLYEFGYLDPAQTDLTSAETLLGNFALACYLKDLGTSVPDQRFEFKEDEENIAIDDVIATVLPGTPLQTTLASVAVTTGAVTSSTTASFSNVVSRFSSRYYVVDVDAGVTSVQVQFTAGTGLTSLLFQIALIDEDGNVREIIRTDRTTFAKRVSNLRDGKRLDRVVCIVTGAASAGAFSVSVSPAAAASDVMVTRWHSAMRTEYEIDSRNWAWTWVSPDIWVDNDGDGLADGDVFFNFDNELHVRLHNKGNASASGIGVELWYQDASGGLSPTAWLPVRNMAGVVQTLSGLTLAAGATQDSAVDWSPTPSGMSNHFCVKAVVTVPGDPNADNKRVLSNFGNVRVKPGSFVDLSILRRNVQLERSAQVQLLLVNRLNAELEPAQRDLVEQAVVQLDPGHVRIDRVRLYHRPQKSGVTKTKHARRRKGDDCPCAAPLARPNRSPDPLAQYGTDERALPPGVAGKPLVTLVHAVDGVPLGGVTLMITVEDSR